MSKRKQLPVALTIAGSDSGGGAGIQADLKTFAALGIHGASAIACLTAQNPKRVLGIESCSPKMLRQQIEAVFEELNPRAVKIGMLFSVENVHVVAEFFKAFRKQRKMHRWLSLGLVETPGFVGGERQHRRQPFEDSVAKNIDRGQGRLARQR